MVTSNAQATRMAQPSCRTATPSEWLCESSLPLMGQNKWRAIPLCTLYRAGQGHTILL